MIKYIISGILGLAVGIIATMLYIAHQVDKHFKPW